MKTFLKIYAPYLIIVGAVVASGLIVAGVSYAQTTPNITFPIQELGGCTDKQSCQAYCDISAHKLDCVSFAETHGLMSSDDASRAKSFLQAGSGPGGCTDEDSCRAYCADTSHINECLAFAQKTGIVGGEELGQMEKVANAIKNGAKLPGGCTTKDSCEAYCSDSAHLNECVSFAKAAGLISADEADMALKTGGKGPGGCDSQDSCENYCNQKDHADLCLSFAKEHGLIPEDQLKHLQEGMTQMRIGLANAPGETVQCLKNAFGSDIVGKIESGTFTPTSGDGEKIKSCFGEFKTQMMDKIQQGLTQMPAAASCITQKVGADALDQLKAGTMLGNPDEGDAIRNCFEQGAKELQKELEGKSLNQMMNTLPNNAVGGGTQQMMLQWQSLPPAIQSCLADELGSDRLGRIKAGQGTAEDQKELSSTIQDCTGKLQEQIKEQLKGQTNERMQNTGNESSDNENKAPQSFQVMPGFGMPSGGFNTGGAVPAPQQPANTQQ